MINLKSKNIRGRMDFVVSRQVSLDRLTLVKSIHSLNYSGSFSRVFSEFESAIKIDLMSANKENRRRMSLFRRGPRKFHI